MRHICRALALLLVLLPLAARALTPAEARTLYAVDKQKVLTGDLAFDWQQFRLAAVQGGADSFDWHPVRNQFMQTMQAHDAKAALALAGRHHKPDPLLLHIHTPPSHPIPPREKRNV